MAYSISSHWMNGSYHAYFSHNSNLYSISNLQPYPLLNLSTKHTFPSLVVIPAPPDLYNKVAEASRDGTPIDSNSNNYQLGLYPLVAGAFQKKVHFYSLHSLTWIHEISLDENVEEVQANEHVIIVRTRKFIYLYSHLGTTYTIRYQLYPEINCFSLTKNWVAFSSSVSARDDMDFSDYQTTFLKISQNIAQFTTSGIKYLSESIRQHNMKDSPSKYPIPTTSTNSRQNIEELFETHQPQKYAGTIEIRDINTKKVIAHFKSHKSPVYALQFDECGTLLVTASIRGTDLNVYRILPSKSGKSSIGDVSHLYTLERGRTSAIITSISFSVNSKWIAVGSNHGTSHIFAINPFGGPVSSKTHSELVSTSMNDLARKNYINHPKRVVLSATTRIRNDDIHPGASGDSIFSFFYSFDMGSRLKESANEHLYVMSSSGHVGLFIIQPKEGEKEVFFEHAPSNLIVDFRKLDYWKLEKPRSNISVKWESDSEFKQSPSLDSIAEVKENNSIDELDEEGEWISNLELETYNPHERTWISEQLRFIKLENPIERSSILDPNLKGETVNIQLVQMETPDRPLDWNSSYDMEEKVLIVNDEPRAIIRASDSTNTQEIYPSPLFKDEANNKENSTSPYKSPQDSEDGYEMNDFIKDHFVDEKLQDIFQKKLDTSSETNRNDTKTNNKNINSMKDGPNGDTICRDSKSEVYSRNETPTIISYSSSEENSPFNEISMINSSFDSIQG